MTQEQTMAEANTQKPKAKKKADQYNDPKHNYLHYWDGREYEHAAEEAAIRRLLRGKHFRRAVDVGGGYGRLCVLLEQYADEVTLAEPSQQQLDIAATFLHDHPEIKRELMQADDLRFEAGSIDLRSLEHRNSEEIPFVNHNPHTVIRQLEHAGMHVAHTLSVSNLRSVRLKKILPREIMLGAEKVLQRPLAAVYFGPSIFFLVRKARR
jgi:SAM-dependent methyltransferase